jgi:hypothetical protein
VLVDFPGAVGGDFEVDDDVEMGAGRLDDHL